MFEPLLQASPLVLLATTQGLMFPSGVSTFSRCAVVMSFNSSQSHSLIGDCLGGQIGSVALAPESHCAAIPCQAFTLQEFTSNTSDPLASNTLPCACSAAECTKTQ